MAESEELKSLLMKEKEESGKLKTQRFDLWLKCQDSENNIMGSGPITSWQIDVETVTDFIFLGSKVTSDGDCSHEI